MTKPMVNKSKKREGQHKSHHKNRKAKTFEEREQESSQLDNLFLTLREDLIEGHKEERQRKIHKKKASKNKQRKHKKGRRGHSFIEIEEKAPKSASLLQLSRVDSGDLTVDEQAELSLKRMANKMVAYEKRGEVKDDLPILEEVLDARDLNVDDRTHVGLAEAVEQNDLIEPVEEFRPEMRAHHLHHLRVDALDRLPFRQVG